MQSRFSTYTRFVAHFFMATIAVSILSGLFEGVAATLLSAFASVIGALIAGLQTGRTLGRLDATGLSRRLRFRVAIFGMLAVFAASLGFLALILLVTGRPLNDQFGVPVNEIVASLSVGAPILFGLGTAAAYLGLTLGGRPAPRLDT